jgi:1-deoxy-D-xylulose-5-phosphate synthase
MDRSGIVGPDGPTHHGVFDLAFMQTLPGMIVTAPKDGNELRNLIATALQSGKNFSIRYPKTSSRAFTENGKPEILEIGKWEILESGSETAIFAVGSMVGMILDSNTDLFSELGYQPTIINARFVKPLDSELILEICNNHDNIVTIEEGCLSGGFGSAVSAFLHDNNLENKLHRIGIPDNFVEHGTRDELLVELGLCAENIISILTNDKLEEVYE